MCTTIAIKSDSGDVFWGRTMDFTFDPFKPSADSKMTTFPANYELNGLASKLD
ncbi:linear amide C-N hydrolase [Lactobacillus sp. R2/2]|nr:linear amide C-N hydrolase [Lactobacillus sp. R2/2]